MDRIDEIAAEYDLLKARGLADPLGWIVPVGRIAHEAIAEGQRLRALLQGRPVPVVQAARLGGNTIPKPRPPLVVVGQGSYAESWGDSEEE